MLIIYLNYRDVYVFCSWMNWLAAAVIPAQFHVFIFERLSLPLDFIVRGAGASKHFNLNPSFNPLRYCHSVKLNIPISNKIKQNRLLSCKINFKIFSSHSKLFFFLREEEIKFKLWLPSSPFSRPPFILTDISSVLKTKERRNNLCLCVRACVFSSICLIE